MSGDTATAAPSWVGVSSASSGLQSVGDGAAIGIEAGWAMWTGERQRARGARRRSPVGTPIGRGGGKHGGRVLASGHLDRAEGTGVSGSVAGVAAHPARLARRRIRHARAAPGGRATQGSAPHSGRGRLAHGSMRSSQKRWAGSTRSGSRVIRPTLVVRATSNSRNGAAGVSRSTWWNTTWPDRG